MLIYTEHVKQFCLAGVFKYLQISLFNGILLEFRLGSDVAVNVWFFFKKKINKSSLVILLTHSLQYLSLFIAIGSHQCDKTEDFNLL